MLLLALATAFAQSPISITPKSTTELVYVVPEEGVVSKRFVTDANPTYTTFSKGQPLRVLFRENGWVRVRDGEKYGWVPAATVTAESPKVETPPALPVFPPQ